MTNNNMWYAVMAGLEDSDWGTGSYDMAEATEKVQQLRKSGYDDAYIAVIKETNDDAECVEEIHEF